MAPGISCVVLSLVVVTSSCSILVLKYRANTRPGPGLSSQR